MCCDSFVLGFKGILNWLNDTVSINLCIVMASQTIRQKWGSVLCLDHSGT